ncbi:MAG: GGDEF domain-containing protein [Myxococcales bacterium]
MSRVRRSIATRIALLVGPPAVALALAVVYYLKLPAHAGWTAVSVVLLVCTAYALAMRTLLGRSLGKLMAAMERAERGDFLVRATIEGDDEVAELGRRFNAMLAKITDLRATQIDTERDVEHMQNELRLKAQVEAQKLQIEEANRRLEARVRDLSLLFDLTRSINSTLEPAELLKRVTEMVGVTLGVEEFAVALLDDAAGELEVAETFGFPPGAKVKGVRFGVGEGISGLAAQTGEIQLVPDTSKEPRYRHYGGQQAGDGSFLSVPLKYKGKVVGVLNFSRKGVDAFRPEEVELLQSVANQAALAIMNARLFQETVELSLTDPLTGTANRRHLFDRLELEVTRAQRFGNDLSLVMIDIDHFKLYNDRNGHPAGDEVLKGVAAALERTVRKVDTVARYGGEEFSVILPQIRREEALAVAEKLRRSVEAADFPNAAVLPGGRVTISVGLAHFPSDAQDQTQLLARADAALYAAKNGGRNRVYAYADGMRPKPGALLDSDKLRKRGGPAATPSPLPAAGK